MPAAKYADFKEVKHAVSMTDILDHYDLMDSLLEKDGSLIGQCPIHKGTSPTQFRVLISKSWWNCFGPCNGGNILNFVAEMEDVSIPEAAVQISEWFGLSARKTGSAKKAPAETGPQEEPQEVKAPQEPEHPEIPETQEAQEREEAPKKNTPLSFQLQNLDAKHPAIEALGFDESIVVYFGAGVCSKGLMKGRLAIPIHSPTGELLAYTGYVLERGYKYPENFHRELELYNIHRALESGDSEELGLFLVPYPLDVWRFHQAGFENVVAVMGSTMSRDQVKLLASLLPPSARVSLVLPEEQLDRIGGLLAPHFYVRSLQADPSNPNEVMFQMIQKSD